MDANRKSVPVNEKDRVINFLPFSHVFERGWACLSLAAGAELIVNTYPKEIQQSMRETHPQVWLPYLVSGRRSMWL